MGNSHGRTWNVEKKTEKCGKKDTHTVGPGKWRERVKNEKNVKHTMQEMYYVEKNLKSGH